jgi:hypothetical protein
VQCAPCGSGTQQSWWPCNVSGLCQCAAQPYPTTAPITTTTTTPYTSARGPTGNPCANCGKCTAVFGNMQGATSAHCAPCANNAQTWWPCNVSGLCKCSAFFANHAIIHRHMRMAE